MDEALQTWVDDTWERIDKKMRAVSVRSRNKLPYTTDAQGIHDNQAVDNVNWWTNGFWCGLMWLLYTGTGEETYKTTALQAEKLLDGAFYNFDKLQHDAGFMWRLSSGVNWDLNQDKTSRTRCLYAAATLAARFNIKGGYITAWNGKERQGWTIIDSMMNLPLLYWAAGQTQDDRYTAIATAHADMAMRDHVRPDGSVNHIVEHSHETGEAIGLIDGQGYAPDSAWSRGTAWALYGFTLSYLHTGRQEYLDTAKRVAHYFIAACCGDWLVRVDFRAPEEPVMYDSTAACCAACGLLELAGIVPEYEKELYRFAAVALLQKVDEHFCSYEEAKDYLVGYGTHKYPVNGEMKGVHIPIIYGDYFYVEALYKLKGFQPLFW